MTLGDTATFGVDLGGTNLRIALVDPDGSSRRRAPACRPRRRLDEIVDSHRERGARPRAATTRRPVRSVSAPRAWSTTRAPSTTRPTCPAFLQAPVRARARGRRSGLPTVVDNDANVAVVAELVHGAARGCTEVLLITLGTGIGGGVVTRGEVLRGAHGFGAEVGHFQVDPNGPICNCGQRGHWEALASGTALGVLGRERAAAGAAPSVLARTSGSIDEITGVLVGDVAQSGAADAIAIVEEYARQRRHRVGRDSSTSSIPSGWWCRGA